MRKLYIILCTITAAVSAAYGQSPSAGKNYVMQSTVRAAGHKNWLTLLNLPVDSVNRTIQYLDGLGRPVQAVQWKGSPAKKDLVQLAEYNGYGREERKYRPYAEQSSADGSFKSAALTNLTSFYTSPGWDNNILKTAYPYSVQLFDASPLNLLTEQGAPGAVWQPYSLGISGSGHTLKTTTTANVALDSVKLWVITSGGAQTTTTYGNGTLNKTILKDENWTTGKQGTTEEFKDKQGRVVLKKVWQSATSALKTWYVYDDYGNLAYVIPPGVNTNTTTSFSRADVVFKDFIYGYIYDGRNRVSAKKIPGKGWDFMVYNKLDQVVLTQDSVQRVANKWLFTKYDAFARPVLTGMISSSSSRATWASVLDTATVLWESRDNANSSGTATGYTNKAQPAHSLADVYYTISYFDDYSFYGNSSTYNHDPAQTVSGKTKGLATAQKVSILGSVTRLLTVTYYDTDGRVVETVTDNHLGGLDRVRNAYNFAGELTSTTRTHKVGVNTTTIANTFSYDHAGRKLSATSQINGGTLTTLNKMDYNELGVLKQKWLHKPAGAGTFLQTTKFAYNERGWLKGGNSAEFNMRLGYDTLSNPQYNGNISAQLWGNMLPNKFLYTYDQLNRLTNGTSTGIVMSEALTYDLMGNIKTMNRDGAGTATYSYSGNKLTGISDGGLTTAGYAYDGNGNATTDGRNGVTLSYNMLNLPMTAVKSGLSITYTYDAAGNKLKKVSNTAGTTDYIAGIQYQAGVIDFVQTEEGIARNNSGTYSYEYNLTDHLGNVRYSFNENPATHNIQKLQEDNYFPFGKQKVATGGTNKYLYNGKELQDGLDGQYDYGARFYDPEIGRWNVIDPLVELYQESTSPYAYVQNNPILLTDPDGRYPDGPGDDLWNFIKGAGRGIATGAKGTVNFVTDGAWKAETWKATGNLALGLVASNATGPGGIANTYSLDAALGTNTSGAVNGFNGAIASGLNKLENGNAGQKGEVVGQVLYGVAEAVAGSKGAGMAANAIKGARTAAAVGEVAEVAKSTKNVFTVTTEGVVLPKGTNIPASLVENPYRSSSFGTFTDGKFAEKLRIDPATPINKKGPNVSHFHLNGGKEHIFDITKWPKN